MKLPRDLSAAKLIKALEKMGYKELRQTGSHVRLVCVTDTEHHLTIPSRSVKSRNLVRNFGRRR